MLQLFTGLILIGVFFVLVFMLKRGYDEKEEKEKNEKKNK